MGGWPSNDEDRLEYDTPREILLDAFEADGGDYDEEEDDDGE